jgi:hypothetical protein
MCFLPYRSDKTPNVRPPIAKEKEKALLAQAACERVTSKELEITGTNGIVRYKEDTTTNEHQKRITVIME